MCEWKCGALMPSSTTTMYVDLGIIDTVVGAAWKIHSSANISGDGVWGVGGGSCCCSSPDFFRKKNVLCLAISEELSSFVQLKLVWEGSTCFPFLLSFSGWIFYSDGSGSSGVGHACFIIDYPRRHVLLRYVEEARHTDWVPLCTGGLCLRSSLVSGLSCILLLLSKHSAPASNLYVDAFVLGGFVDGSVDDRWIIDDPDSIHIRFGSAPTPCPNETDPASEDVITFTGWAPYSQPFRQF